MAAPARASTRASAGGAGRTPQRSAPALPLRDWKRAFAIVDAITAEYRSSPWFRGVRASRDPATDSIRLEVEVSGAADQLARVVPTRLRSLGVRLRAVAGEPAVASGAA